MITDSSPLSSGVPALPVNEVRVWRAALDLGSGEVETLKKTLAPDERAQAARFHFPRDRKRFIARRGLLRQILACYLGRPPDTLRFGRGPAGKLFLLGNSRAQDLHFNLARSHGLALYALARNREVGVDVERIEPDLADQEVAGRFFSPREFLAFRALPASLRVEAFFNCWTRKEAYLKARGEGLFAPLDTFDVSLAPGQPAALLNGGDGRWSLHAFIPAPGYAAALAVEGCDGHLRFMGTEGMMGRSCAVNLPNRGKSEEDPTVAATVFRRSTGDALSKDGESPVV
jgi:4'-phosphopantetheinyl transferase